MKKAKRKLPKYFKIILIMIIALAGAVIVINNSKIKSFDDINNGQTANELIDDYYNDEIKKDLVVIVYKNDCSDCKKIEKSVVKEINKNKANFYIGINAKEGISEEIKKKFPNKSFERNGKIYVPTIIKFKIEDKELIEISKSIEETIEQSIEAIKK